MSTHESNEPSELSEGSVPGPAEPDFYRQVLHYMPTPVVVVDNNGKFIYMNQALLALGGWEVDPASDLDFLTYVHPQDRDALALAFLEIVESPGARILGSGRSWAEIYFRIITADGSSIPIELVGNGGLMDTSVGGIIYEVRPARTQDLLGRVLQGLSRGASMHHLLSLVGEMIAGPPLDMEAAIFQSTPDGGLVLASSTSPKLTSALRWDLPDMPCGHHHKEPALVDRSEIPIALSERLTAAGFQDIWCVAVESPLTQNTLRIVAASPTHHVPANGPKNRIVRASELAAAVLLRTQADVLLEYAADHDPLTNLPNRAAFYQLAESLDPATERAALHLDLDGLKRVNTELGPACGDAVLQIVADRLRAICSSSDIIGRIGDDEFTVIAGSRIAEQDTEETLVDHTMQLAYQLLEAVGDTVVVAGRPVNVSASIGVAIASPSISTDHLLTWADAAMHDAKTRGGGRVCRFGLGFG